MVNDPPLLASGPFSATTVEILKPALASVEEVPAKYSTESYSASDNEGDETDLPTTTTKIIVSVCEVGSETVRERRRNILGFGSSCWLYLLSPYIFILCSEVLSGLCNKAQEDGSLQGICVARGSPRLNHLLFADDTMFFIKATKDSSVALHKLLKRYEEASGQTINPSKSSITFSRKAPMSLKTAVKDELGIQKEGGIGKYLGLPEHFGRKKRDLFASMVERIKQKASGWSNRHLSAAGKMTMLKECSFSCPVLCDDMLTEREKGDLGPVHGFQWRHFGAKYTDMHADYTGQGFDQLLDVINKIKNNPDDRRIIMSAWNPSDLKLMALPPCHMFAQFFVANGELSCQMYQRSADMGLGVPFNIASYSLLSCILAHVCDLVPGDFIHVIGDAHVYKNHVRPLQEQLENPPKPFPVLKINPEKKHIDSFVAADFELIGYDPHKKIDLKMAV